MANRPRGDWDHVYEFIDAKRSRVLACVTNHYTVDEITETTGTPANTIKDWVLKLEDMTGCRNVRELARWWDEHRSHWIAYLIRLSGARNDDVLSALETRNDT